ncbi:hypothetical protein N7526_003627 [Penicillium atrosanguineum]|nr:hypothetical protein N7526_003627 [Penicillium atrosanguineum]
MLNDSLEYDPEGSNEVESVTRTSASCVKVEVNDNDNNESVEANGSIEDNDDTPDVYDINVVAWDSLTTPLHLAILHGHVEAVKELVSSFGADVLMPVKIVNEQIKKPHAAILTLVLVPALPFDKAREMSQTLLELGGSPAQADLAQWTSLHYIAQSDYSELLDLYMEHDGPAVQRAINNLAAVDRGWYRSSPTFCSALVSSIQARKHASAKKLLEMGTKLNFSCEDIMKVTKDQLPNYSFYGDDCETSYSRAKRPILCAIECDMPLIALDLLNHGVDPNAKILTLDHYESGWTALDGVRTQLTKLRNPLSQEPSIKPFGWGNCRPTPINFELDDKLYLKVFQEGTYKMFFAENQLKIARESHRNSTEQDKSEKNPEKPAGMSEKNDAISALIHNYEILEKRLLVKEAKTIEELGTDNADTSKPSQTKPNPRNQINEKSGTKKPFMFNFNFSRKDITDVTHDGYLQFHLTVAKVVIHMLRVQYEGKKPEAPVRLEIDSDADSSDDENLNLVSHEVDDQFTFENIGEVTTQVKSNVLPIGALQRSCDAFLFLDNHSSTVHEWKFFSSYPSQKYNSASMKVNTLMKYAIIKNDLALLDFLLVASRECSNMCPDEDESEYSRETSCQEFQLAMVLGHNDCLAKLIRFKAVGLPLAKLSENSGVRVHKEPGYYQGLSIRGKSALTGLVLDVLSGKDLLKDDRPF